MTATVPEYRNIDRALFEREIVPAARPAIIRGLVAEWPVVAAGRESVQSLTGYLRAHATNAAAESWFGPPEIAGRFDFTNDLRGYNHDRKLATIDQLLDLILRQCDSAAPWSIYAGALPLERHAPKLLADNPVPLLDPAREMLVSLWLGNRTVTAAHWDLPQNLACVVAGRRRFTLFPTDQVGNLYVGPIDRTLAGQPSSMVDVGAPDFDRFPRFRDALAVAEIADLEPGDALYMPSLWWHSVQSLDAVGAMVNFWWRDDRANEVTPMLSLMHAATTMRGLPTNERAAWKTFFDHYVFHADGDPVSHLPDDAHGLLGGDAGSIAAFRARLAATLR